MKISVCIAVYNGAAFLGQTIPIILSQLSENDEVIIIDDASTDHSIQIIKNLNDSRIQIHQNKENKGVNYSFFKALEIANGDLLFIADQDDFWKENKVQECLSVFKEKGIELLVHDGNIMQDNIETKQTIFGMNNSGKGFLKNLWSDCYVGCCMVMTAKTKDKLLPKRKISSVYYDHYLGLMAELKHIKTLFHPIVLIDYNRHGGNHTNIYKRRNLLQIIIDRLQLLRMLVLNRWF